jgi:hypothetical protein
MGILATLMSHFSGHYSGWLNLQNERKKKPPSGGSFSN